MHKHFPRGRLEAGRNAPPRPLRAHASREIAVRASDDGSIGPAGTNGPGSAG